MKRTALRLICLLLCAVMVMGMIPAAAAAAQNKTAPAEGQAEGFIFKLSDDGTPYYEPATFDLTTQTESDNNALAFPAANSSASTKISTPTDLTWHKQIKWNSNGISTSTDYGSIYFKVGQNYVKDGMTLIRIRLYRNDKMVLDAWSGYDSDYISQTGACYVPLYLYTDFTSGEYYFTIQLSGDGYEQSEIATSPVWNYTKPSSRYARPTAATWEQGPVPAWTPSNTDYLKHHLEVYYTPDKDSSESIPLLMTVTESDSCPDFADYAREWGFESGYFYFRVRTFSNNINKKYHSAWTTSEYYSCADTKTELKIVTQPKSVWVKNGTTAKVTVEAEGDGLTYKWYYKNPGQSKYTYTSSFKGNSYSITMNEDRDGRYVYCKITDKYGNTLKTKTVSLNMQTPLEIVSQPKSVKVASGKTAKVTVEAEGDGLTYKWYYKNPGASKYSYTSAFTGNSYSVTMNADRDGRYVYCKIYDKWGNMVKTNTVSLRMK